MMSVREQALEVWLDSDLGPSCRVGTLAHDRGQLRFHYEREWLRDPRAFALDPDLSLGDARVERGPWQADCRGSG